MAGVVVVMKSMRQVARVVRCIWRAVCGESGSGMARVLGVAIDGNGGISLGRLDWRSEMAGDGEPSEVGWAEKVVGGICTTQRNLRSNDREQERKNLADSEGVQVRLQQPRSN